MAIDLGRVIEAAVHAAAQEAIDGASQPRPRARPRFGRAVLLGAAVVTGARLLSGDRGRELMAGLQDRLDEALEPTEDEGEDEDAGADEGAGEDDDDAEEAA